MSLLYHLAAELFEKEAMAWDSLQTRCKMPAGAPKEEASGRPKRRSDRKAKRPKAEKMNGRALKVAKLTHNQAGPNPAVGKVKATDGRIAVSNFFSYTRARLRLKFGWEQHQRARRQALFAHS